MSYLLKKKSKLLKVIRNTIYIVFFFTSIFGAYNYTGNKFLYSLFTITNIYLIIFAFRKKAIFFETFFSLLLFLGYWFKFTMIISFTDGVFREGVGNFDYSSNNFDYGLIISIIGIIPLIIFGHIRERFFYYPEKINLIKNRNNFFVKYRKSIIFLFLTLVLTISMINAYFQIYQKGLLPINEINFFFSGTIKWLLLFGLTSISTVLIFLEYNYFKKIFNLTIFISLLEVFLSSLSMISRGMIFNSSALLYGIYKYNKKTVKIMKKENFYIYVFITIVFFYLSVMMVNTIRTNYFYVGKSAIETKKETGEKLLLENIDQKYLEEIKSKKFNFVDLNNEVFYLIINRWVGIDSTLVVSQNKDMLSKNLFVLALNEKPKKNYPTFYEKTFFLEDVKTYNEKNPYVNVKGNTLTGVISFLFFTGSFIFLFIGMLVLVAIGSLIEIISYKISNSNLIFASLIGQIIAFRYIHFGYLPKQSYLLFGSIILTLIIMYMFMNKFIKN